MNTVSIKPKLKCGDNPRLFCYSLQESGLLSEDQLAQVRQQLDLSDVPSVSASLLQKGWLNSYQLTRIHEGQGTGLVLGQYRITAELGEGGFGTVYKAVHALMDRQAALKVISPKWAKGDEGRKLFLREVLAISRLAHPNIALVYEAGQSEDALWFAMEYVDGPNLDRVVATQGPLPIPFVCALVQQVARALQCAHENGMVHRDVKPANLLLPATAFSCELPDSGAASPAAIVKVVDFGLARLASSGAGAFSLCADGVCVGTPEYMSPEQARNSHEVDTRSDLYSLGCTFYFALTGRPPFQGETEVETITQHQEDQPRPIRELRPDVPPGVAAVVHRLLAKDPNHRFAAPAELIQALYFARDAQGQQPLAPSAVLPLLSDAKQMQERSVGETPLPKATTEAPAAAAAGKEEAAPLWRDWLALVGNLSRNENTVWKEHEYGILYEALLAALRDLAKSPAPHARPFGEAASFVEPWVSWRALAALDKRTLDELWQSGRRLDAALFPAGRVSWLRWTGLLLLLAGSVGLLSYLLFFGR